MTEILRYIHKAVNGEHLSVDESARAFQIIMNGGATPPQLAALLVALKMNGETVEEIAGGAKAMRAKAKPFPMEESFKDRLVDTCGTGGDGQGTYNVSTAVAIVLAACGVPVAKHGNRAVSSLSGSSDVFKMLGVNIDASEGLMARALRQTNLCFLLAPRYHQAMRHVAPTRHELGMRTIFNILGPLSNPAGARRQLLGVFSKDLLVPMAQVLKMLGSVRAWVVHGKDGLDEITTTGISYVAELKEGKIREFQLNPAKFGIDLQPPDILHGGDAEYNAIAIRRVLEGKKHPLREIVRLNSAAALVVADKAKDIPQGLAMATEAIDSGKGNQTLEALIAITSEERAIDE
jgi:anthranilate phosphoribosyltransferase